MSFVEHLNKNKANVTDKPIFMRGAKDGIDVEIALQYNDSYSELVFSFANNINTVDGGTHLSGFRAALTRTINNYAAKSNLAKDLKDASISGDDVREGLTAVVSVKIPQPQFEGQTKAKLGNTEVKGIVEAIVNDKLGQYLEENPAVAKRSSARPSTRPAPAKPPARPAISSAARALSTAAACPASWPTARSAIRRRASSTSSRANRPAARPSRAATAGTRRSCRSRARSSTSKRPASTRCWATTKSRP